MQMAPFLFADRCGFLMRLQNIPLKIFCLDLSTTESFFGVEAFAYWYNMLCVPRDSNTFCLRYIIFYTPFPLARECFFLLVGLAFRGLSRHRLECKRRRSAQIPFWLILNRQPFDGVDF